MCSVRIGDLVPHFSFSFIKTLTFRRKLKGILLKTPFALFQSGIEIGSIVWGLLNDDYLTSPPHLVNHPILVAQLVKNPPAMQETWVWSLGWEDPLKKGKATHSSILAWRSPWGHKELDTSKRLSLFHVRVIGLKEKNIMKMNINKTPKDHFEIHFDLVHS